MDEFFQEGYNIFFVILHLDLTLLSNLETLKRWKITKKWALLRKLKLYFLRIVFIDEISNSISITFLCGS